MTTTLDMPVYGGQLPKEPLADLSNLSDVDIAWSAGFVDGEGAIMIAKSYKQISLILSVTQSTTRSLDKLVSMYGGRVVDNSGVYGWRVYGVRAGHAIRAMQPYLVEKADHALIAIHFIENCQGPKWAEKEACYNKMAKLQKKRYNNGRVQRLGMVEGR
jgi:hypothetical protein